VPSPVGRRLGRHLPWPSQGDSRQPARGRLPRGHGEATAAWALETCQAVLKVVRVRAELTPARSAHPLPLDFRVGGRRPLAAPCPQAGLLHGEWSAAHRAMLLWMSRGESACWQTSDGPLELRACSYRAMRREVEADGRADRLKDSRSTSGGYRPGPAAPNLATPAGGARRSRGRRSACGCG
jgi:hypothetical protein